MSPLIQTLETWIDRTVETTVKFSTRRLLLPPINLEDINSVARYWYNFGINRNPIRFSLKWTFRLRLRWQFELACFHCSPWVFHLWLLWEVELPSIHSAAPEEVSYNCGRNVDFLIANHDIIQIRKTLIFLMTLAWKP